MIAPAATILTAPSGSSERCYPSARRRDLAERARIGATATRGPSGVCSVTNERFRGNASVFLDSNDSLQRQIPRNDG